MAVRKSGNQSQEVNDQPVRRRGRRPKNVEPMEDEQEDRVEAATRDDEDSGNDEVDFSDVPAIADFRQADEPDPRAVDDITERIFGSVLSRFGWERHGSRIEHVGDEAHPHQRH